MYNEVCTNLNEGCIKDKEVEVINLDIQRHIVTLDAEKNHTQTVYIVPIEKGPVQTWKKSRRSMLRKGVLIAIPMANWSCYIRQNELPKTDEEEDRIYRKLFEELYGSVLFHWQAKEAADQIAVLLRNI